MNVISSKNFRWFVVVTVFIGILLRLYGLSNPLTEAWNIRQAQTAMMARNIFLDGVHFLPTRLDFFGNSSGDVVLEFPLMHMITASLYWLFGVNEIFGRLVSLGFFALSSLMFLQLALLFLSRSGALCALIIFTISPWNIFLGRAFMPEASMMFFYLSGFYLFSIFLEKRKLFYLILGVIALCLAPLTKPPAGLVFLPVITSIFFSKFRGSTKINLVALVLFCTIPFAAWGIYANYINASNPNIPKNWGNWLDIIYGRGGILGNWLSWDFYRNVGGSIVVFLLTPVFFIGALLGLWVGAANKKFIPIQHWLFGCVLFIFVLAGANRGHPYYQIFLLPPLALYCGLFFERYSFKIINFVKSKNGILVVSVILAVHVFGYYRFYQYMYDPNLRMPNAIQAAGIIKKHFPEDRYALIHQKNATSGVLDYYIDGNSKPIKIEDEQQAIELLITEVSNGANIFVSINTVYGNSLQELRKNEAFILHLETAGELVFEGDNLIVYAMN